MTILRDRLADCLRQIFSSLCDDVNSTTLFSQRLRKFSPADFVRTVVLTWLEQPSATLADFAFQLNVSPQAIDQRFSVHNATFFHSLLTKALSLLLTQAQPVRPALIPLLQKFTAVFVEDNTTVALPASLADTFPGCGGQEPHAGAASLKIHVAYEVTNGTLQHLNFHAGRVADTKTEEIVPIAPPGTLVLRDLGFFDRSRLAAEAEAGVHWITRLPTAITLHSSSGGRESLMAYLARHSKVDVIDEWVCVGQTNGDTQPLAGRLIALRCPPEIAARRRQKVRETARRKGRTPSERQLAVCEWQVLLTNVPEEEVSATQAWEIYRVRWQVELLFKRWKSVGGLCGGSKRRAGRALCEVYAKMLGLMVAHWVTLLRGGPLAEVSVHRLLKCVQWWVRELGLILAAGADVEKALDTLTQKLKRLAKRPRSKKRVNTRQRLINAAVTP